MKSLVLAVALPVALMLSATVALAADAPAGGNVLRIGGPGGGKPLTRDELRSCLSQQKSLKTQADEVAASQAALDAEKAEVGRLDAELAQQQASLQTERATVDVGNEAAVAAFNAKLAEQRQREEERNGRADAYNAKLATARSQAERHASADQSWKAQCAGRSYSEIDFYAIQRGK